MRIRCRNCGALGTLPDYHGATTFKCPACEWQEVLPPRRRIKAKLERQAGAAYAAHQAHEELAGEAFERVCVMTPRAFERFCAELLEQSGYVVAETNATSAESHALELRRGNAVTFAACRRVAVSHAVEAAELENLAGAMRRDSVAEGIFITTGTFADACGSFAADAGIALIDGDAVRHRLAAMELAMLRKWGVEGSGRD